MKDATRRVGDWLAMAVLANFAVFLIVAILIGGDAMSGYSHQGHYFLSAHGHITEVSEGVFRYSQAHVLLVWVSFPLAWLWGAWRTYERWSGRSTTNY